MNHHDMDRRYSDRHAGAPRPVEGVNGERRGIENIIAMPGPDAEITFRPNIRETLYDEGRRTTWGNMLDELEEREVVELIDLSVLQERLISNDRLARVLPAFERQARSPQDAPPVLYRKKCEGLGTIDSFSTIANAYWFKTLRGMDLQEEEKRALFAKKILAAHIHRWSTAMDTGDLLQQLDEISGEVADRVLLHLVPYKTTGPTFRLRIYLYMENSLRSRGFGNLLSKIIEPSPQLNELLDEMDAALVANINYHLAADGDSGVFGRYA